MSLLGPEIEQQVTFSFDGIKMHSMHCIVAERGSVGFSLSRGCQRLNQTMNEWNRLTRGFHMLFLDSMSDWPKTA
jgi:hypothetical protein